MPVGTFELADFLRGHGGRRYLALALGCLTLGRRGWVWRGRGQLLGRNRRRGQSRKMMDGLAQWVMFEFGDFSLILAAYPPHPGFPAIDTITFDPEIISCMERPQVSS